MTSLVVLPADVPDHSKCAVSWCHKFSDKVVRGWDVCAHHGYLLSIRPVATDDAHRRWWES